MDNKPKKKTPPPTVSAQEKAQAVLAVWTERCKPVEVCRQFKINWMTFNHWQRRAMEGMLQALESRANLARGEALSPRLQALLQRQQRTLQTTKLTHRLEQLQQNKLASPPAPPAKTE
jgi:transposase-like protein